MGITAAANILYAEYREGRFPMAETADEPFMIVTPYFRGLLPIPTLHIPRSLLKTVHQRAFEVRIDTAFDDVMGLCAEPRPERPDTWINPEIRALFNELHRQGRAHSVECWSDDQLVGGLYGLAVGGVFCGESMASRQRDASKVALVHLCARLWAAKFTLLDAQFHNPHLEQFGLYEVPQETYTSQLSELRDSVCDFTLQSFQGDEYDLVVSYLKNR